MTSDALIIQRIEHWLRNRHLVFHEESMNKSIGYSGTVEAILALIEHIGEYEDERAAAQEAR